MKPHFALKALLLILAISGFQTAMAKSEISAEKQTAIDQVNTLESEIANMSMELWNYSEIALREHKSAEFLATILETEGFTVERGVAHMPTAFVAEWGKDSPVVGILAEYDALPNIGNAPVPKEQARDDGHAHGHGCGHNLFGAGSVAAAIALKRTMQAHGIKGTVKLFGSPAEETVVGKVYMAAAGPAVAPKEIRAPIGVEVLAGKAEIGGGRRLRIGFRRHEADLLRGTGEGAALAEGVKAGHEHYDRVAVCAAHRGGGFRHDRLRLVCKGLAVTRHVDPVLDDGARRGRPGQRRRGLAHEIGGRCNADMKPRCEA